MRAALALGRRGLGRAAPNPSVGALVVRDGVVIGRGVTAAGGRPHAEPLALVAAGTRAKGATMYVTLEPCSHHGRTKPCTEAIVAAGIARVVIAVGDPDPRVAGRGIEQLRSAGVSVTTGVCESLAHRDHRGHIRRVVDGRPAVTLKLAETPEGYAAGPLGTERLRITGPVANDWVHMLRAMHDAVLVGIGTALEDDPLLTVRLPGMGSIQPARVVLDTRADLRPESRLVASARTSPVLVLTGPDADPGKTARLRDAGADVVSVPTGPDGRIGVLDAMQALAGKGLTRVLCEGGPRLAQALLRENLVDEVIVLSGTEPFGPAGRPALDESSRALLAGPRFRLIEDRRIGKDRLRRLEKEQPCLPA